MTIMVESSRSFLFTEYARTGCGTFKDQGTDPKAWDALPVSDFKSSHGRKEAHSSSLQDKFSAYPNIQKILQHAKEHKEARRQQLEIFYNDDRLAENASE